MRAIHRLLLSAFPAAAAGLLSCSPAPGGDSTARATFVPASGERIWIAPFVNKSGIEKIPAWPREPDRRLLLEKEFGAIAEKFAAELRRCEKLGLYTVVDDSTGSTMSVKLTFGHARQVNDTLFMSVLLHAEAPAAGKQYDFIFQHRASIASGPPSPEPFHVAALLLAGYRSSLPVRDMAYPFYAGPR